MIRRHVDEDAETIKEIKARIVGAKSFLAVMGILAQEGKLRLSATFEDEAGNSQKRSVTLSSSDIPPALWESVKDALDGYVANQNATIDLIAAKYAIS